MTTILLIRHGQTDWNLAGRWQGHEDVPLNETGISQAHALAARLAGWPIRALYTSDLRRAAQTAEIVAKALGLGVTPDPLWRERDVGLFAGLTTAETIERYTAVWEQADGSVVDPPEGEPFDALRQRAETALNQLLARHNGEMVAVVSHGALLYNVIAHVLGLPANQLARFSLSGNTGLSVVTVNEHGPRLTRLNDTAHLE